jgi:hypothetical protein
VVRTHRSHRASRLPAARAWFGRLALGGGISLAALGLAGVTAPLVHAVTQTLTLTTTGDPAVTACPASGGDPCSLRQAITVANGDSGDTISLPAGTYSVTQGVLPPINESMSFVGASAATTIIDGPTTADGSTFSIGAGGLTVDFSHLTIQDTDNTGAGGGAVSTADSGVVSVTDVALINNAGGYVGGWQNDGSTSTTMTDVTISGNQTTTYSDSAYAAGLRNDGTLTLINVTIANNVAGSGSHAAGGIENTGSLTIINSDVVGNRGDGSTDTGAGGMYLTGGSADVVNSIVSGNTSDSSGPTNCSAPVDTTSHNIEDGTTCGFTGSGDQNADPDLGALAYNGGELATEALQTGSPAIQAALRSSCPTDDERGVVRITGSDTTCDIGAYEYSATTTGAPVPATGAAAAGDGSVPPWALVLLIAGLVLASAARLIRRGDSAV